VTHTYNPSYSRGRDQEDHGSKPAQANNSQDPIQKNPSQKRADGAALGLSRLWVQTPVPEKKKGKETT
jgi:hypothetical protein